MTRTFAVSAAILALVAAPVSAEDSAVTYLLDSNVTAVGCDSCCDPCCDCGTGCDCGDGVCGGFSLASILGMDSSGWDVGGWTQFGYHDGATPLSRSRDDLLSFNDVPHDLNLQQQWFYIGKEADGSNGLDWGMRMDVMYGTDAQKTQAFGNPRADTRDAGTFDASWDHGVYGWAMPQLYAEVAYNDLSVIVGHFFTLVGYEVVPAPQNFFYSHSLTMFNSEPFTHTGVLTTYTGFENITFYNGWTLGWDTGFDNFNSGNNYLGGFSVGVNDAVTLTYINTYGNFGARDGGDRNSYSHSIVLDVQVTERFQYVGQTDLVDADDVPATGLRGPIENNQVGLNQYLFYSYTDAVKLGGRIEWWKNGGTSFYEATSGVNFFVLDNLVVRPEYRKDWSPAGGIDEETVAFDMILTY